jgi:hypothetical protein
MSVNQYPINDNPKGYGQNYNELAMWYISCLKNRSFKNAKEALEAIKKKDVEMAKEGEQ